MDINPTTHRRPSQAIADDALTAWRDYLDAIGAGVACRAAAANRQMALLTREMNGGAV
jgi:hypothetical protein